MKSLFSFLIIVICLTSCDVSSESDKFDLSNLSQSESLTGLWFVEWDHASGGESPGFTPGSYGYAENPNVENFYLLNSDGSGFYIERRMNITGTSGTLYQDTLNQINTNDSITYEVVTDIDGVVTVEDVLSKKRKVYWGVDSDGTFHSNIEDYNGLLVFKKHIYDLDPVEPRCTATRTIDKYALGVELQILELGALKQVDNTSSAEFIAKYSL